MRNILDNYQNVGIINWNTGALAQNAKSTKNNYNILFKAEQTHIFMQIY